MPLFTTLNATALCREIDEARHHVVYAAPGLTVAIADSLIKAFGRCQGRVAAVLDVSTRVAHLGYGEFEAVQKLVAAGVTVRDHRGLRLGTLLCDGRGWAFSMAPRLVEADPTADGDAFNAIALTEAQVIALRAELPAIEPIGAEAGSEPSRLAIDPSDADVGTEPSLPPVVGEHPLEAAQLTRVQEDLRIAPPRSFDLAQQVNTYASMIQFVELELEGFNIGAREVRLPESLPVLATQSSDLKNRLSATLRVLGKAEAPPRLVEIRKALDALRGRYLFPVGRLGRVILKRNVADFQRSLDVLREEMEQCRDEFIDDLDKSIQKVIDDIAPELAKSATASPPLMLRMAAAKPTLEQALEFVRKELAKALPTGKSLVQGLQIHCSYKDVTLATLKDGDFIGKLKAHLPDDMKQHPLVIEMVAAVEASRPKKA